MAGNPFANGSHHPEDCNTYHLLLRVWVQLRLYDGAMGRAGLCQTLDALAKPEPWVRFVQLLVSLLADFRRLLDSNHREERQVFPPIQTPWLGMRLHTWLSWVNEGRQPRNGIEKCPPPIRHRSVASIHCLPHFVCCVDSLNPVLKGFLALHRS